MPESCATLDHESPSKRTLTNKDASTSASPASTAACSKASLARSHTDSPDSPRAPRQSGPSVTTICRRRLRQPSTTTLARTLKQYADSDLKFCFLTAEMTRSTTS